MQVLNLLQHLNDSSGAIPRRELAKLIYGRDSVFSRTPSPAQIRGLARDDVVAYLSKWERPDAAVFGISGRLLLPGCPWVSFPGSSEAAPPSARLLLLPGCCCCLAATAPAAVLFDSALSSHLYSRCSCCNAAVATWLPQHYLLCLPSTFANASASVQPKDSVLDAMQPLFLLSQKSHKWATLGRRS